MTIPTRREILDFYSALREAEVSIKDWCEAAGISTNLLYQELNGHHQWVPAHAKMVREVSADYRRELNEPE